MLLIPAWLFSPPGPAHTWFGPPLGVQTRTVTNGQIIVSKTRRIKLPTSSMGCQTRLRHIKAQHPVIMCSLYTRSNGETGSRKGLNLQQIRRDIFLLATSVPSLFFIGVCPLLGRGLFGPAAGPTCCSGVRCISRGGITI